MHPKIYDFPAPQFVSEKTIQKMAKMKSKILPDFWFEWGDGGIRKMSILFRDIGAYKRAFLNKWTLSIGLSIMDILVRDLQDAPPKKWWPKIFPENKTALVMSIFIYFSYSHLILAYELNIYIFTECVKQSE